MFSKPPTEATWSQVIRLATNVSSARLLEAHEIHVERQVVEQQHVKLILACFRRPAAGTSRSHKKCVNILPDALAYPRFGNRIEFHCQQQCLFLWKPLIKSAMSDYGSVESIKQKIRECVYLTFVDHQKMKFGNILRVLVPVKTARRQSCRACGVCDAAVCSNTTATHYFLV